MFILIPTKSQKNICNLWDDKLLSSLLKIQFQASDLYSGAVPELSVPNKCGFLKTMILQLALVSPRPQEHWDRLTNPTGKACPCKLSDPAHLNQGKEIRLKLLKHYE